MVNPLKIEVTEAIRLAAKREYLRTLGTGDALDAALTAAFQHPEFVRQIREQVMRCVGPDATPTPDGRWAIDAKALVLSVGPEYATGNNAANHFTRASLGRLLGEG
jgi:hypothetical protein